jgi:hypothetical protein
MKIEVLGGACAFARRETVEVSVCEGLFVKPLRLRRQYLSDHAVGMCKRAEGKAS